MRILIVAGAFLALAITPALTDITLTKTGPDFPVPVYEHGGGGGP